MKLNNLIVVVISGSGFALSGCGVNSVKYIEPSGYITASDYASAVIENSGCIGKVDALFISPGVKQTTREGLEYIFNGNNLHCSETSFKELMAGYCRNKGGQPVQGGTWCSQHDEPLFYVGKLTTLEKSANQSHEQWFNSAIKKGFISERVQKKEALTATENQKLAEKERSRIRSLKINFNIGDSICREDYDVPRYQYPSKIFYQGYVESKSGHKIKVRIFKHGGEKVIINDVTPNPVLWVESTGWFHCG